MACRSNPTEERIAAIARAYLTQFDDTGATAPLVGVSYHAADEVTPYDRWVVAFLIDLYRDPPVRVVEVLPPDLTPQFGVVM